MIKVLIIEDDSAIREMLMRRLTLRGFAVEAMPDGESGLARLRQSLPDVLLLDHGLPGISGWDVARKLRADPSLAKLPIIALTAHAGEPVRKEALAAGCDVFLTKPVDMKALERAIAELLSAGGPA